MKVSFEVDANNGVDTDSLQKWENEVARLLRGMAGLVCVLQRHKALERSRSDSLSNAACQDRIASVTPGITRMEGRQLEGTSPREMLKF